MDWLSQPAPVVAPALLGMVLVRQFADGLQLRAQIVETEAYAPGDPACHAYRRQTKRNRVMFGPAGHLYVYLIYGMYHCLNIVTEAEGIPAAVLIRAVSLNLIPEWIPPQKRCQPERVGAGPGLLCQALRIDCSHNGWPLRQVGENQEGIWLEGSPGCQTSIVQTTRIGIRQGADIPWRWYIGGHPSVSRY
ncbi:MAG: DNA-3-methyladenine glycosylase [Thermostichus sp. DG_1_6_bins_120]